MKSEMPSLDKSRSFYGWVALSGAVLALLISGGAFSNSFGVFLPVITADLGWSRAAVAAAISLGMLAFGLPSPLWGILVTKFGPRINIILGNLLAAMGLAGLSFVQEVWQIYLLCILIGLGSGLAGFVATTTVANNWFVKRVSLAMGICATAGGLSGFMFPPFTTALISSIDWRLSWLVLAGIVLIGAVFIGGFLMVRNRPEDMGQVPDGISSVSFIPERTAQNVSGTCESKYKNLLRVPSTWFIAVFGAANGFAIGTMTTHQVAYLRDLSFSPMTAATTLSVWAVFSIIGSMAFGILALKVNIRYLASVAFMAQIIAMVILLTLKELVLIYIYSALLGISVGALVAALPTFIGAYFGRARYSKVMGLVLSFHVGAYAIGGAIAGFIYDTTASYVPAFVIVIAFSLIGLISVFIARPLK